MCGLRAIAVIFTLQCIFAGIAAAGVYKWVDEKGKVHYGDRPPTAVKREKIKIKKPPSASSKAHARKHVAAIRERSHDMYAQRKASAYQKNKLKQSLAMKKSVRIKRDRARKECEKVHGANCSRFITSADRLAEARKHCRDTHGVDCDKKKFLDALHPLDPASQEAVSKARRERRRWGISHRPGLPPIN